MTAKKTVKKKYNPTFVVDYTNINSYEDIELSMAIAKKKAEVALSNSQFEAYTNRVIELTVASLFGHSDIVYRIKTPNGTLYCRLEPNDTPKKKVGLFKRIWNWVTRKK